MADRKITDLSALSAGSQATGDLLTIVDVSESAAADKNKKITVENLFKGIPGDVGVGTSAPSQNLHIFEATGGDVGIRIQNNDGFAELEVDADELNYNADSHVFNNQADSSEFLRINSSGNLGFGTASPQYKTHVFGGSDSQENILFTVQSNGVSNSGDLKTTLRLANSTSGSSVHAADISAIRSTNAEALAFSVYDGGSSPEERVRLDSSGRLLIGTTSSRSFATPVHKLQIEDANGSGSGRITIGTNNSSGSAGPGIYFFRSRGAALGSNTIVSNNDVLGSLFFQGADGTDTTSRAAEIKCEVQGTPGSNDMPGRLIFLTTENGGNSPAERLRIDRDGKISTGAESSPDVSAGGLCLDQNATDGIILSFKSSDISHGVTNFDQTDTYFSARKVSGDKGGLRLRAYTDAAGGDPAFFFQGIINSDADSSYVPFAFQGGKANGATISNIAVDRKIIDIRDSGGTSLASFTGSGLTFNGDTAAANALDDYEEGTWVATLTPSSGFTPTSNTTTGYYTKIGRQVTVITNAIMTIPSSLGSYVNNSTSFGLGVSGLPFTIANAGSQGRSAPVIGVADNIGFSGGYLTGHGSNNTTQCSIFVNKDNGAVRTSPTLTASQSVNFHFCFTYFI